MDTAPSRVEADLYERDELAWLETQASALRAGRARDLDWDNLAEFLDDMAGSQRRALTSHLETLMMHRIKIMAQPERHTPSWSISIYSAQDAIRDLFETSPSLKATFAEKALNKARPRALRNAALETRMSRGLTEEYEVKISHWTFDDVMTYKPPEPLKRTEGGVLDDALRWGTEPGSE